MDYRLLGVLGTMLLACAPPAIAQRQPVLRQIDLPHPYYYREMYLPQLTSGPSSLCWSADSRELVYSMAGSLWRQSIGNGSARQLTAAASYDYQPDWSPDGRWIVYSSYRNDSIELWILEVASGEARPLLQNGAVNAEPRFSPDGRHLVFVSTADTGHFHLFMGELSAGHLSRIVRLTGEHSSDLPRYYYSHIDHEISPVWSRDGTEILFVSNQGHLYGTGGFWRMAAAPGATAREIHFEETSWRARPDLSPDGSRLVYASYTGRSWHNLWMLTGNGGDALAIGYGDWDQMNPRWAPDGRHIAFIGNRGGNTEIELLPIPGGGIEPVRIEKRQYLNPTGAIHISLRDADGNLGAARISVTDSAGRFYAPANAWIHADDGFDRRQTRFEAHYFHLLGDSTLEVPVGRVRIEIVQGLERGLEEHELQVAAGQTQELTVSLDQGRFAVPAPGHWISGDLHVHMNYGGTYRNDPAHLVSQARAENLNVIESLIVNKEQRFPDIAYEGRKLDPASLPGTWIVYGQEFHTSYWGHLGLLGMRGDVILPGYAGYPNTAASSLVPSNADVADIAHAGGGLVGYVHPFDELPQPFVARVKLTDELPIDVALGKVDYIEALGFSDHRSTSEVWYRLLNLGFRIPAGAGTDAMADFASLRGPVGMNRVYARTPPGEFSHAAFIQAISSGRSFATNGPLLGVRLGDATLGDELHFERPQGSVPFEAHLRSIVPVDHLELVCNGRVVRSLLHGKPAARSDFTGTVELDRSGWCLLRASTDGARYPVLDNYVFATTSPIYVDIAHRRAASRADADYFLAWIDRVAESTAAYPDWNNAAEKAHVLEQLATARAVYLKLR